MRNLEDKLRLKQASEVLRTLCFVGLVIWVALGAADAVAICFLIGNHFAKAVQFYQLVTSLGLIAVGFTANLNAFYFFKLLRDGQIFEGETVLRLRSVGRWCVGYAIGDAVVQIAGFLALGMKAHVPPGGALLAGLVIMAVAWLFQEAVKIQEEQKLTI